MQNTTQVRSAKLYYSGAFPTMVDLNLEALDFGLYQWQKTE